MKILIVDDSLAIQAIVRRGLQKEGFAESEFRTAGNGEAALEIVQSWLPDLVITDWHMPGMSGLELLQVLRQTLQQTVRVGFVTTESIPERLEEALRNGAAFILAKPFTERQLGDAARQALGLASVPDARPVAAKKAESDFRVNDVEAIEHHLYQTLKARVHLDEVVEMEVDGMATPWYMAFYSQGKESEVHGICVLDRDALVLIGGRLAGLPPSQLRPGNPVPDAAAGHLAAMLKYSGHQFFASPDNVVPMLRSQLLHQVAPKVREIVGKGHGRKVFRMRAGNLSLGLIVLLAH